MRMTVHTKDANAANGGSHAASEAMTAATESPSTTCLVVSLS